MIVVINLMFRSVVEVYVILRLKFFVDFIKQDSFFVIGRFVPLGF